MLYELIDFLIGVAFATFLGVGIYVIYALLHLPGYFRDKDWR